MANTYRITLSGLLIADQAALAKAVFPQWSGEPMSGDASEVLVTFDSPQTPAPDLGPLVKVELVTPSN